MTKEFRFDPRALVRLQRTRHTLSAQSIFRDVHAAAENRSDFLRGVRAANSARLFDCLAKSQMGFCFYRGDYTRLSANVKQMYFGREKTKNLKKEIDKTDKVCYHKQAGEMLV